MRIQRDALLALPALLSALVVAVPSPAAYQQHPLPPPPAPQPSRWRTLSDRLIASIWGFGKNEDTTSWRENVHANREPPGHILAQYGSDLVLRFNLSTAEEASSLAEAADTLLLDVWEFSQDWVDIRLSKDIVPSLLGLLPDSLQQSHKPLLHERELAQAIYNTYPTNSYQPNMFFQDYQPLSTIRPWMFLFASLFRTHTRLINIGTSYEGRDILALRLGVHPTNDEAPKPKKRPTVLIMGGSHAREWVSTSTVLYVAYSLMTGYGKAPTITKLLEEFDIVFIPTLNPDGYVYTWETDRLWRKNRQPTTVRFCHGIDLDHGFGFEWAGHITEGNPCSESFAGQAPFEAFESKKLAEWARNETENNNVQFVSFVDLHSYSQQILYPYSYSCTDTAPGQENLEELALGLEKAIRISSSLEYEVMAACEGNVIASRSGKPSLLPNIEHSGGSALDWFYHEMRVRYAYQIKLRDRGTYGFLLPKENIVPTGQEILDAVLYLGKFLMDGYPKQDVDAELEDGVEGSGSSGVVSNGGSFVLESMKQLDELVVEDLVEEETDWEWDLRRRRRR